MSQGGLVPSWQLAAHLGLDPSRQKGIALPSATSSSSPSVQASSKIDRFVYHFENCTHLICLNNASDNLFNLCKKYWKKQVFREGPVEVEVE